MQNTAPSKWHCHLKRLTSYVLALCLATGALAGCANGMPAQERNVIVKQDSNTLWHIKTARGYEANNRLELAREHFLYALASCNDEATRDVIVRELEAVDLMIKTQR